MAVVALVDEERPPAITARLPSGAPVYSGGDKVRAMVTQLGAPQGIVALFARPPRVTADHLGQHATRIIAIEAVDNPINVGSIVRNAVALGWDGMIFDYTSADPLSRRSLRVSMGQAISFPAARTVDLAGELLRLGDRGFVVCALTPDDDADDIGTISTTDKMCIVIGSERAGLSAESLNASTARVRIPMAAGVDSLNAAAASAIACYALRRR